MQSPRELQQLKRKAQLEEDRRNRQLHIGREEQERQQQIEQARIDRLLGDAESLRQATNIRAYVAAVQAIVANETASISAEKMAGWSERALAQADRIDPVRSPVLSILLTKKTTQIKCGAKCGVPAIRSR
jgi:hypothetical protein